MLAHEYECWFGSKKAWFTGSSIAIDTKIRYIAQKILICHQMEAEIYCMTVVCFHFDISKQYFGGNGGVIPKSLMNRILYWMVIERELC